MKIESQFNIGDTIVRKQELKIIKIVIDENGTYYELEGIAGQFSEKEIQANEK